MKTCRYDIGHQKLCGNETNGERFCSHHSTRRCVSCHEPATHNCTVEKSAVCAQPLCDTCEHRELPRGLNGQIYQHARPGEELAVPHYGKVAMEVK